MMRASDLNCADAGPVLLINARGVSRNVGLKHWQMPLFPHVQLVAFLVLVFLAVTACRA